MNHSLKAKTVLITGGTGSWGQELVSQILRNHEPSEVRVYSRGEHKQVDMRRRFPDSRLRFFVGDVRDKTRISFVMRGVNTVFHLAAMKHVPVCEENPWEAVQTNIIGTQNVVEAAIINNVEKAVYVSSDKAVDPFNLYGATKSCGEQLFLDGNTHHTTQFVSVRAGNVIGSAGSVVPLFSEQIRTTNALTLTDERMTRFFMKIQDAILLLLKAAQESVGGEILVMKMPACKIADVARVFKARLGNLKTKITMIGVRPGEKLFEALVSSHEIPHTYDLGQYYVILPRSKFNGAKRFDHYRAYPKTLTQEYRSGTTEQLDHAHIEQLLEETGWLDARNVKLKPSVYRVNKHSQRIKIKN